MYTVVRRQSGLNFMQSAAMKELINSTVFVDA